MAAHASLAAGRLVRVSFERGEDVLAGLLGAARAEGMDDAEVWLRGALLGGRMVLGRRPLTRAVHDPDRVSFDDERQVVGHGRLSLSDELVALSCVVGRQQEVVVGDLVDAQAGEGLVATVLEAVGP